MQAHGTSMNQQLIQRSCVLCMGGRDRRPRHERNQREFPSFIVEHCEFIAAIDNVRTRANFRLHRLHGAALYAR